MRPTSKHVLALLLLATSAQAWIMPGGRPRLNPQTACVLRDAAGNVRGANVNATNQLLTDDAATSATASAVPVQAGYVGGNGSGNLTGFLRCDNSVVYDTNTNGKTQLVGLVSGKVVYVCSVALSQSTTSAVTVSLGSGTGTNCGTTYTAKTPAWPLQAPTSVGPTGIVLGPGLAPWFQTAASEELCISTNAAVSVQALVSYTQF